MEIALLGGTGDIGQGLALRWAYDTNHTVSIGSRKATKAETKAEEYETELASLGRDDVTIHGLPNEDAAARADVVVVAVPSYHLTDTIDAVADDLDGATLVVPAVGMQRDEDGFHYNRPRAGSVTQLAANAAPDDSPVVGAFHNLAAGRLANLDATIDWDTIVVGDDADAKDTVCELAEGIEGMRALDGGPLANAAEIEGITPVLVNVARHNEGLHDLGIRLQ